MRVRVRCLTCLLFLLVATPALIPSASRPPGPDTPFDVPFSGSFASKTSGFSNSLHLISWNIDRGYDLQKIEALLKQKGPDLCLLQEVDLHARRTNDRDVARELAQRLSYNYAFGTEFQELSQNVDGNPAFHGQATLTRWPIVRSRILRFQKQSSWWKPHSAIANVPFFQRRLGGRIALVTDISIDGKLLVVYNLHLESRSGGAIQTAQLNETLEDLKQYPEGTPAIVGGDFNSKYHPVALLHEMAKQGFHSVLGEKLARTHVIIGYFDWIFYRGPWRTETGEVVRNSHASDHDLIEAELTASGRKNAAAR